MLKLEEVTFKEFQKDIYPHYLNLFPKDEQKPLSNLKKQFKKGILKFVKILDKKTIGFLIYETLKDNPLVLLDYFAIYPEYQNQKYGSKAIDVFKTYFNDFDGVYGEIEKEGLGKDDLENETRKRRINFWKNLGFELLETDLELFGVIYSPCILKIKEIKYDEDQILAFSFSMYKALLGERKVDKNCRILKK